VHLLEDVGRETTRTIEREAALLADWIAAVRIGWSFPTPLDEKLRASGTALG
jgi:hypothetical protein